MARSRSRKRETFYPYECQLTGETYKIKKEVTNTDDLVSIKGYYELHPEMDDRPESVLTAIASANQKAPHSKVWEELVALAEKQKEEKEAREATSSQSPQTQSRGKRPHGGGSRAKR